MLKVSALSRLAWILVLTRSMLLAALCLNSSVLQTWCGRAYVIKLLMLLFFAISPVC